MAVGGVGIASCELLRGGASNLNYLIRFDGAQDPVVLRVYTRDPGAGEKEIAIMRAAFGRVPVPEVVCAETGHAIYRFVEGITFQQLKSTGNAQDIAEAAYAIGAALALVRTVALPWLTHRRVVCDDVWKSVLLEERIGERQADRLRALLSRWRPRLDSLTLEPTLVHGDFNARNTILKRAGGRWVVSAILDWEMAVTGSPLWDAARFICYEKTSRPCREPHFSRGFTGAGGTLPADWQRLARVINLFTAAEGLSSREIPSHFVPELCHLIAAILDEVDP